MKKLISILLIICALTCCLASCVSSRACQKCGGTGEVFCHYCVGEGKLGTRCSLCEGDGKCAYCDRGKTECKNHVNNCPICHGSGVKTCTFCDGADKCFKCRGSGYIQGPTKCEHCSGWGKISCTECED